MTHTRYVLGALVALALLAGPALAADSNKKDKHESVGRTEKEVSYASLPQAVKQTLEKEKGKENVLKVVLVKRGEWEFYRATVESGKRDRDIFVDREGRFIRSTELTPEGGRPMDFASLPAGVKDRIIALYGRDTAEKVTKATQFQEGDKTTYIVQIPNEGKVTFNEAGKILSDEDFAARRDVPFDSLPGPVRTTLGKQYGERRVERVVQGTLDNRTLYRARIQGEGLVWLDPQGKVVDEGEIIRAADLPEGRALDWSQLPKPIQQTLGKDYKNRVERVVEYTKDGKTYYRATIQNGGMLTLDEKGNITDRHDERRENR